MPFVSEGNVSALQDYKGTLCKIVSTVEIAVPMLLARSTIEDASVDLDMKAMETRATRPMVNIMDHLFPNYIFIRMFPKM